MYHNSTRPTTSDAADRPVFTLMLRPQRGIDPIRALRHVLKGLLRQHGLQCIAIVEEIKNENPT